MLLVAALLIVPGIAALAMLVLSALAPALDDNVPLLLGAPAAFSAGVILALATRREKAQARSIAWALAGGASAVAWVLIIVAVFVTVGFEGD